MSNKVLITNDQNVIKIPSGLRILIRRSCNAVLDFEKFDGPAEISVTFVDNNRIHELNLEYRSKDSATRSNFIAGCLSDGTFHAAPAGL